MSTTGFIVKIKNSHVQFTKEITTAGIVTLNENQALSVFPLADMRSQSDPVCWPLDIILLLDQSTSMQANDAKNYRIDGALEILDRLIMNQQEFCKEAVHRYGLIEFGGSTRVVLNLSEIGRINQKQIILLIKKKLILYVVQLQILTLVITLAGPILIWLLKKQLNYGVKLKTPYSRRIW